MTEIKIIKNLNSLETNYCENSMEEEYQFKILANIEEKPIEIAQKESTMIIYIPFSPIQLQRTSLIFCPASEKHSRKD